MGLDWIFGEQYGDCSFPCPGQSIGDFFEKKPPHCSYRCVGPEEYYNIVTVVLLKVLCLIIAGVLIAFVIDCGISYVQIRRLRQQRLERNNRIDADPMQGEVRFRTFVLETE